jgi:5-oxoprolinase (ATP-hydrolysing)
MQKRCYSLPCNCLVSYHQPLRRFCHIPTFCCRYAGVLSAVGIHLADIVQEAQEPAAAQLSAAELPALAARLEVLAAAAGGQLRGGGFKDSSISTERFLNLR